VGVNDGAQEPIADRWDDDEEGWGSLEVRMYLLIFFLIDFSLGLKPSETLLHCLLKTGFRETKHGHGRLEHGLVGNVDIQKEIQ